MPATLTKRALVAESDPFQAVRLGRVLESLGYQVQEASEGLSAKEAIDRGAAQDLLVCDLSLPLIDGFGLVEHLRKKTKNTRAFVAAISGFPSMRATALKQKAELGIDDVLSKTYDESTLTLILKRSASVLEQRQAMDARDAEASGQRESERLALIAGMHLVDDGPPEAALQKLAADAAALFNVPIALISLVLGERQWFKAYYGLSGRMLDERGLPRDLSICAQVVSADSPETLVVPDAREHPLFKSHPLVVSGELCGYVGAPLKAASGHVLGTLCLVDRKPLQLKPSDLSLLNQVARRVGGEIELQQQRDDHQEKSEAKSLKLGLMTAAFNHLPVGILFTDAQRRILVANRALSRMVGRPLSEIVGRQVSDFARANIALFDQPADYINKMKTLPEGPYVADEIFYIQRPYKRLMRWTATPMLLADGSQAQLDVFTDLP